MLVDVDFENDAMVTFCDAFWRCSWSRDANCVGGGRGGDEPPVGGFKAGWKLDGGGGGAEAEDDDDVILEDENFVAKIWHHFRKKIKQS